MSFVDPVQVADPEVEVFPFGQELQEEDPGKRAKVFAGHWVQVLSPAFE
eukprot:CAMPEP_0173137772 /NCGR_PEP_ID=MMETSP1105-20130129/3291_1 /TAXON_ID=2985 /ORGANISM="Ochromonas sp., Strain BG-1" /LENGTH=48 /DNA_ID= /DNA_START= /DNA_END= /DNA_ORIENTATION=